ncbi:MAG: hypothetical protein RLZZ352_1119 [Pseudomonadota bacterium]|jgi:predicted nucleic acid-binding protein
MKRVLVDTSVWVDHFRHQNNALVSLLERDRVVIHPLVIAEIACGTPPRRQQTLSDLSSLQTVIPPNFEETLSFIEREKLFGLGCGWVDLQLLHATQLGVGLTFWTLDKRLHALAQRFGVAYSLTVH